MSDGNLRKNALIVKGLLLGVAFAALFSACAAPEPSDQPSPESSANQTIETRPPLAGRSKGAASERLRLDSPGVVDRVVDGDTLVLKDGRKVRLLRIDTPEREEWGYGQATSKLKGLLGRQGKVRLELEDERKDRYGRVLAYVYANGKLVNLEMVRSGWTPFYTKYGKGKYVRKFNQAEAEAKKAKRGVWGARR